MIILTLKIPPHLKCVATLPREMSSMFKTVIVTVTVTKVFILRFLPKDHSLKMTDWRTDSLKAF